MATSTEDLRFVIGASVDLRSITDAVSTVTKHLSGSTIAGLVKVANPMVFDQWSKRLADIYGVIGGTLTPVLEIFTDMLRLFGDVLANLLPNSVEVREALSAFRTTFAQLSKDIRDLMAQIGPDVREALITGLKAAAYWTAVFTKALAILVQRLTAAYKGIAGEKATTARTALGAAAVPARITSFEEFEKNLQTAFASIPREDPAVAMARDVNELLQIERDARNLIDSIDKAFAGFQQWMADRATDFATLIQVCRDIARLVSLLLKPEEAATVASVGAAVGLEMAKQEGLGIMAGVLKNVPNPFKLFGG